MDTWRSEAIRSSTPTTSSSALPSTNIPRKSAARATFARRGLGIASRVLMRPSDDSCGGGTAGSRHAAVDRDLLAGDVRGVSGREERNDAGYLLGFAEPLHDGRVRCPAHPLGHLVGWEVAGPGDV